MAKFISLLIIVLVFQSCKKEFVNPYDSETPGESWMPYQFNCAVTGNNSVALQWKQDNLQIDGFTLVKRKNMVDQAIELDKNTLSYVDAEVVNPTEINNCAEVSYLIYARAGNQKSNAAVWPSKFVFPRPTQSIAGADITSSTLMVTLNANSPGQFGTGQWSIVSGIGGSFSNSASPTSNFTGIMGQVYVLSWTISLCNASTTDNVTVAMPLALPGNGVSDNDGNTYSSQIIGTQEWMGENLKTTKYQNGDAIPNLTGNNEWTSTSTSPDLANGTGAWCHNNNQSSYNTVYGKLYNWYAVVDPRNVCPAGWHVPNDAEWSVLINYLDPNANGGDNLNNTAGNKMKSIGTQYWAASSAEVTNQSGFSAEPAGLRYSISDAGAEGAFIAPGNNSTWWSSTRYANYSVAWARIVYSSDPTAGRLFSSMQRGYSVRCIKN
jgi:uncharacterized protein (TIGR02145 family)